MNRRHLVAFAAGLLFALGLGISGMTEPVKVTGFLDFFGDWDPSLALVMLGAIAVNLVPTRLALRRPRPVLDTRFHLAPFTRIDARLLGGAAIFGVGWGLSGFCPGPAIVAAGAGVGQAVVFSAGMLGGMAVYHAFVAERTNEVDLTAKTPCTDC